MQPPNLAKRVWLLLFLVVGLSYLYGLGNFSLVGPDEPRYAEVAREMFLRRDLITPTLGGHPWFEKPALLYWMMIAGFYAFGVSEWTARLGPALSGLLTVAAIYWLGRRLETGNRSADKLQNWRGAESGRGTFGALVAASSGGLIVFSRGASFDMLITMSVTFALAFFLASEIGRSGSSRHWFLGGFYCFVGVSLLAKGLVGIVVPFGVIVAYFGLCRKLPDRIAIVSLLWGMPLALAVAAAWYAPVIARNGWSFIDQFFVQHHFARYLSNKYHHPQPIYFYLPVMLLFSLPWTPFLIEALFKAFKAKPWRWCANDVESKSLIFLFAWLAFPLLFFSFSGSKLPGYVLPSLPAAALLAGDRLAMFVRHESTTTRAMRATGLLLLLLSALGMVYAGHFGHVSWRCSFLVVSPALFAGVMTLVWVQRRTLAAVLTVLSVLAAVTLSLNCAVSGLTERETVRALMLSADGRGYSSAPVFMFEEIERTAEFYAAGRLAYAPDGEPVRFELVSQVVNQARQTRGPILMFMRPGSVSQLTNSRELKTILIATNGRTTLVVVQLA